jgi:hypothetical protein
MLLKSALRATARLVMYLLFALLLSLHQLLSISPSRLMYLHLVGNLLALDQLLLVFQPKVASLCPLQAHTHNKISKSVWMMAGPL